MVGSSHLARDAMMSAGPQFLLKRKTDKTIFFFTPAVETGSAEAGHSVSPQGVGFRDPLVPLLSCPLSHTCFLCPGSCQILTTSVDSEARAQPWPRPWHPRLLPQLCQYPRHGESGASDILWCSPLLLERRKLRHGEWKPLNPITELVRGKAHSGPNAVSLPLRFSLEAMLLACFKEIFHAKLFSLISYSVKLPFSLIPGYITNIGSQFRLGKTKL